MAIATSRSAFVASARQAPQADLAGPVTATIVVHFLLLAAYVAGYHGDLSALVCADQTRIGRFPFERITSGFGENGYDGQFCYVLARDPWRPAESGTLDLPGYRHRRILYPALAWALSGGGEPNRLLWALPAINLAAIGVLAWLGATLANHYGRSPWWGFLLPIVLNVGFAALRNLTDPLSATAICGLVTAHLLGWRAAWLGLWAAAAVLSREQNLAIVGVVLVGCWRQGRSAHAAALLTAIGIWAGWSAVLYGFYQAWQFAPGNLGAPLAGIWWRLNNLDGMPTQRILLHIFGMTLLTAQLLMCWFLPFSRAQRTVVWLGLAGAALMVFSGNAIMESWNSYMRVLVWMPLAVWFWAVQTGRRWPVMLLSTAALWPLMAVARAWLLG
jgi:hypothetical protein